MKVIMLGAPGAGKGTQSKKIAKEYNIPHISTGDIFRANIKSGTELGKKAHEYISKGLLVPDELTVDIVVKRLQEEDCSDGYILDGFPRTIPQAEALDKALIALNQKIDFAVNIEVSDESITRRMSGRRVCPKCGATYHIEYNPPKVESVCDACGNDLILREDDREETVLERLKIYHKQTQPLIEYYSQKDVLVDVDGMKNMDEVTDDIIKVLGV